MDASRAGSSRGWLSRHRGGVALGFAAGGFAAAELTLAQGWLPSTAAQILVTTFEGALVGSVADWFAVTALFRRVPIPLLSRHTNLIAKRRAALSRGIVDMVEREWLSPAALRERLSQLSFADLISQRLRHGEGREALRRFTRGQCVKWVARLGDPRVEALADELLARLVERIDVREQLAPLLRRLASDRRLEEQLWQGALGLLDRLLVDPQLFALLRDMLLEQLEALSEEGRWQRVKVWLGKRFLQGDDDRDKIERLLDQILRAAREQLVEVEADPCHPLRLRMRAQLRLTAARLGRPGEHKLAQALERGKQTLFEAFVGQGGARSWLAFFQRWLAEKVASDGSQLNRYIDRGIDRLIDRQLVEPSGRARFDARLRRWCGELIDDHPGFIGAIVRESLSEARMPTQRLVGTIEEKVGPDLQWIRVNGAVVGGGVALLIAVTRALFGN
ncbi:DUF445 domain-containing protein [Halotalea alkalilenta]|uniref:DUF445 domain-containing protein n=1 Tax=Halotalea alkalilenta TaxID=376489 RepID=A0A172YFS1_9GAMM|nr:DUF445 domain-containing protein [Halotalea alkalilenta]ANF58118.1 hypothetical protein A5892_12110 [Halotalea alkalilenta]